LESAESFFAGFLATSTFVSCGRRHPELDQQLHHLLVRFVRDGQERRLDRIVVRRLHDGAVLDHAVVGILPPGKRLAVEAERHLIHLRQHANLVELARDCGPMFQRIRR
jgi:hypothetical protein